MAMVVGCLGGGGVVMNSASSSHAGSSLPGTLGQVHPSTGRELNAPWRQSMHILFTSTRLLQKADLNKGCSLSYQSTLHTNEFIPKSGHTRVALN